MKLHKYLLMICGLFSAASVLIFALLQDGLSDRFLSTIFGSPDHAFGWCIGLLIISVFIVVFVYFDGKGRNRTW